MITLLEYVRPYVKDGVCIGFSGGVDSSLVLAVCLLAEKLYGGRVAAIFLQSPLTPREDYKVASALAAELGTPIHTIERDTLSLEAVQQNSKDRCYHCKTFLFKEIREFGIREGIPHIFDGTNSDDEKLYRPGRRAIEELGVISPLAACQLTKAQVRAKAKAIGLSVHDRPSKPCLATRFPYDSEIDRNALTRIEEGEGYLSATGFVENRIRLYGDLAKIEIPLSQIPTFIEKEEMIVENLHRLGFNNIELDQKGFRSGSMDEVDHGR